jgi:hypothetical protein
VFFACKFRNGDVSRELGHDLVGKVRANGVLRLVFVALVLIGYDLS